MHRGYPIKTQSYQGFWRNRHFRPGSRWGKVGYTLPSLTVLSEPNPDTEIVLPPSTTFPLAGITDPSHREEFLSTLRPLDPRSLGRLEVDQLLDSMKLVMMLFGQKMATMEAEMATREAKMENRLLQQDQELKELRSELAIMRLESELNNTKLQHEADRQKLSTRHMSKVIKLAQVLEGDDYRPYAVKQALSNGQKKSGKKASEELLPGYQERLLIAQNNGFKWRNNVVPSKASKKLEKLLEWEQSYESVEGLPMSKILDCEYVFLLGQGAEAAALDILQKELKINLVKKFPKSTRHNLYQRAVRIAIDRGVDKFETQDQPKDRYEEFVSLYWPHEKENMRDCIVKLFRSRGLCLKSFKMCTTQSVQPSPDVFPYRESDVDQYDWWISIRDGHYDGVIEELISKFSQEDG